MKSPSCKYLFGLGALLLLALVVWSGFRAGSTPPRLAIELAGVENDPITHPPNGLTVLHGGRGLCAIFAVTNISKDASIWFTTWGLEQKVGAEWRRIRVPRYESRVVGKLRAGGDPWFLVDSDDVNNVFPPGRGWYYVVPWPANVPTNAAWRLKLRYGRAPSQMAEKIDNQLGVRFFAKRRKGQTMATSEVRQ
jgi:hypothetical protein